jgi:hypothetical protein
MSYEDCAVVPNGQVTNRQYFRDFVIAVTFEGSGGNIDLEGYATEEYVDNAIDAIEIPTVPTNVSAFTNDAGYLTQHQSLDGKADKVHEHTEYANKTHNHSLSDITDYVAPVIPSIEGLATEKYVDDAIANLEIPETDVNLEDYYTKTEVNTLLESLDVEAESETVLTDDGNGNVTMIDITTIRLAEGGSY